MADSAQIFCTSELRCEKPTLRTRTFYQRHQLDFQNTSPVSGNTGTEELPDNQALYQNDFYVVSPRKLWVMTMGTMGIYSVYWLYAQWLAHQKRTGEDIWPIPRAIFNVFFVHGLFRRINEWAEERGSALENHLNLAWAWVLLTVVMRFFERFYSDQVTPLVDLLANLLTAGLIAAILFAVQKTINRVSGDTDGASNAQFSFANWFWLFVGALIWYGAASLVFETGETGGSSGPAII
ncbi:hypothetical protein [Undibacterium luofuense]|uniref:hypothetical protein n=1 Tax=Undibacterium luofuense TaxID=2828733 RepID=UPI0030ED7BFC